MQLFDVCAVRFIKTTSEFPAKRNNKADFICLGHFDMMHIDKLASTTPTPLYAIKNDREVVREGEFDCPANCVYSLYIFKNIPESEKESVRLFWEEPTIFTVVTRIHCTYPENWEKTKVPFSVLLEEYFSCPESNSPRDETLEQPGKGTVVSSCSVVNASGKQTENVSTLFYDSLELGDTVAVMKSNSITAVMEAVQHISKHKVVRDTYTYCGVKREIMQNEELIYPPQISEDVSLESVTTRCSVRDIENVNLFVHELGLLLDDKIPQYFVTGTADLIIGWHERTEKQFIQLMWGLTQLSDKMHLCFNDIITRIGISREKDQAIPTRYSNELEVSKLVDIHPIINRTKEWLKQEREYSRLQGWKYTLLKLLETLEAMHANYVMDDLAELLIPSVNAFLERVEHIRLTSGEEKLMNFEYELIRFMEYWTMLTNDIAQLESQLTQHPELSPIRYYIPATILRFEQRFVQDCGQALSGANCRQFAPLLVPTEGTDLATVCPLDPREEVYTKHCPLLVFIPFKDLYHPWATAIRITHEMGHYCDTNARNRNLRHYILQECFALYIAKCWYSIYFESEDRDEFGWFYQKTVQYSKILNNYFTEHIDESYPSSSNKDKGNQNGDQWYLSRSQWAILDVAGQMVLSNTAREQYIYFIDREYFSLKGAEYFMLLDQSLQAQRIAVQFNSFQTHMDALTFLCSECFADIAMVLLLNCDFGQYYSCVFKEEFQNWMEKSRFELDLLYEEPNVMRQILRLSLVIYGVQSISLRDNHSWDMETMVNNYSSQSPFIESALHLLRGETRFYSRLLKCGTEEPFAYPGVEEIEFLKKYISKCAFDLYKSYIQQDNKPKKIVEYIRDALHYVADESFAWNEIYKYINGMD